MKAHITAGLSCKAPLPNNAQFKKTATSSTSYNSRFCHSKMKMTLIYSVFFWFFLKASRCQLQCVKETFDETKFSINVTGHVNLESGSCRQISYKLILPTNTVTAPYKRIWFKGDPTNIVTTTEVGEVNSERQDSFKINGLPKGEYEYGLKLEWGCNQTYVFPQRVHISVSALTQKPMVWVYPMVDGEVARVTCRVKRLCSGRADVHWKWTKADGTTRVIQGRNDGYSPFGMRNTNELLLTPTADDHNTNITCVAVYDYDVVETTVTLTVKFSPKILNSSQCTTDGELLVCVCISRGNPLPPITWPSMALTDYSVSSFSSIQTVKSTFTLPTADNLNTTIRCISSNELGQAVKDIPLQEKSVPENFSGLNLNYKYNAVFPWIIVGVSLSLNLVLLTILIVCTCKRSKSHPKELCEEMNIYASLNATDVEQPYGVISSPNTQT
ncbi:sialic acid-binding Ig-like lectin 6 [Amphiprion ocellaris]|uniref:sialic acid-binding Ig-like lectin 6 n=1 Tax=Amphiprion ocellaris TaxID=80972 RepID=UPI0024117E9E|nr:sialic acid-binding Ig-like lectin 6 [Amphiprion ocellaris]